MTVAKALAVSSCSFLPKNERTVGFAIHSTRGLRTERVAATPSDIFGLCSTLSVTLAETGFLVSHPIKSPGVKTVKYIVRCGTRGEGVVAYTLPDTLTGTGGSSPSPMLCSLPTLMMTHFGPSAMGTFDTLDAKAVEADVASGKLLVVMHADPWAVMLSSTQRSAWKSLLQSLGGKYAALANAGDKAGKNLMQPHPLHDILM